MLLMFKYGRIQKTFILVSVWLTRLMPRLHIAWGSSHRWAGIMLHSSRSVDSEEILTLYTLTRLAFFIGLLWDSVLEKYIVGNL